MLAGQLALVAAAVFTGAAVYVNVAEQPSRLELDDGALLKEWKSAYGRGLVMQGTDRARRVSPGLIGVVANERLALAFRRDGPGCQLALHAVRRHAGQPAAQGYRPGKRGIDKPHVS